MAKRVRIVFQPGVSERPPEIDGIVTEIHRLCIERTDDGTPKLIVVATVDESRIPEVRQMPNVQRVEADTQGISANISTGTLALVGIGWWLLRD